MQGPWSDELYFMCIINGLVRLPSDYLEFQVKCFVCNKIFIGCKSNIEDHLRDLEHCNKLEKVEDLILFTNFKHYKMFFDESMGLLLHSFVDSKRTDNEIKNNLYKSFCLRCNYYVTNGGNGIKQHLNVIHEKLKKKKNYNKPDKTCPSCSIEIIQQFTHNQSKMHLLISENMTFFKTDVPQMDSFIRPPLPAVKSTFSDVKEYIWTFLLLIKNENCVQKRILSSHLIKLNTIEWEGEAGLKNQPKVHFHVNPEDEDFFKIKIGDELTLHLTQPKQWAMGCVVIKVPLDYDREMVTVELKNGLGANTFCKEHYHIVPHVRTTVFYRMMIALQELQNKFFNKILLNILLNHQEDHENVDTNIIMPMDQTTYLLNNINSSLNTSQTEAINMALKNSVTLIQGPPGTGKTTTLVSLVRILIYLNPKFKILICAPSNVAVDNVVEKLDSYKVDLVRIFSVRLEKSSPQLQRLGLMMQVFKAYPHLEELEAKFRRKELNEQQIEDYKYQLDMAKDKIILSKNVVCSTCIGSGSESFKKYRFDIVILDEAAQSTEPESLIPIALHHPTKVCLFGDHKQLGPMVQSLEAKQRGLGISLFERLIKQKRENRIILNYQYRMHPDIASFPSKFIYSNKILNGVTAEQRSSKFIYENYRVVFCNIIGSEQKIGSSFYNTEELEMEFLLLKKLYNSYMKHISFGFISPYEAQTMKLMKMVCDSKDESFKKFVKDNGMIANVDAFQGKEKDIIILSLVRCNNQNDIGFLKNENRLNVALTRAKYQLIIIGHENTLSQHELFNKLLHSSTLINLFKK